MIFTREDILKIQNALLQLGRKDSEFKDANTPLNSDDYIAILQDGINKKVSINNLLSTLGLLKKDDFINVSDRYDEYYIHLSEAITIIANNKRKKGLVITFQDIDGNWRIYQFTGELSNFIITDYWKDLHDFKYPIINTVLPDEEDLTLTYPNIEGNSFIKLKDKEYNLDNFSGLGKVILRKNIVEVEDPTYGKIKKNILYQDMINQANTIYIIQYDFTLGNVSFHDVVFTESQSVNIDGKSYYVTPISINKGQAIFTSRYLFVDGIGIVQSYFATENKVVYAALDPDHAGYVNTTIKDYYKICSFVSIPEGCILQFKGGSINSGAIKFNNTQLILHNNSFSDCLFGGDIKGSSVAISAFGPKCSQGVDDSWLINSVIDICDNNGVVINFDFQDNLYISTINNNGEKGGWAQRNQIEIGKNTHIVQTSKKWIVLNYSTEYGGIIEPKKTSGNKRSDVNTIIEGLRVDGNNIHNGVYGENGIGVSGIVRNCIVKNCITEVGEDWENGGGGKGISFESSDLDVFIENCAVYNCHTGFCYSSYANDNEINVFVNGLIVDGCEFGIRLKDQLPTSAITSFRSNVIKMNNILLRNCTSIEAPIILSRIYGASIINCTIEGPEANRINAYIRGSMIGCNFDILCGQKAEAFVDFTDSSVQPYQPTDISENMFRFRASQARSNNSVYCLVKYSDIYGLTKNIATSNQFNVTTNYNGLKLVDDENNIGKIFNNSISVLSRDSNGVYYFNGTIKDLYLELGGNNFINAINKISDNKSGNIAQRPSFIQGTNRGFMYLDTEINANKITPIWWNGSAWVDATGTPV